VWSNILNFSQLEGCWFMDEFDVAILGAGIAGISAPVLREFPPRRGRLSWAQKCV
jgi:hypothetical protein